MTKKAIYAEDLLLSVRDDPSINGVNFARFKRHIESAPDVREELTCRENNSNGLCDRADKTKEENNTKSTKFRCIMEKDENGFPVRKFVRDDEESPEPECFRYGNYMVAEEDKVQAAKEELLKGIFDVIKKVSEDDRFWIVKKLEDNKYTVGWSIDFPHMYFNEKIKE